MENRFVFITREGRNNPGARVRCYNFSQRLRGKGLNAEVFSFVDNLGAKSGKDEANFCIAEKVKYIYKGFRSLSKEPSDTIFIVNRFNYHTFPVWAVSKFKRIPYIFDMDDWEAREDIGYRLGFIPKSKAEYLVRLFTKNSLLCIAASHYLENYLLQFYKKAYCIPTGVDTEEFKPAEIRPKQDFVFSWHGSLNRPEIIGYLKFVMECFLTLYGDYPFIKLFIAGDGICRKDLVSLIRGYRCEGIRYQGWVHYRDIPRYLDKVDAGLVPLLDKTRFNLSKSPVKLFEYMAKAKPVVASRL